MYESSSTPDDITPLREQSYSYKVERDMIILYSDPLFVVQEGKVYPKHNCFEHQEENKNIINAIKQTGRVFNLSKMNFSYENMEKMIHPKIIHFSAHGHYD